MRASTAFSLLLAGAAASAAAQSDWFIQLEDGSKKTYGDLRAMAGGKCCFPVNFPTPVAYVSSPRVQLFIKEGCEAAFEINSSAYPSLIKAIDLCARTCDAKGCGANGMNVKGVSVQGGKTPIDKGAPCASSDGRVFQDKTCKAVLTPDGKFSFRLLCQKDCAGAYACLEPGFDRSKCAGVGVQTVFVGLGQKCGYVQDNKQYGCGGNKVSCTNGVCVSSYPAGR